MRWTTADLPDLTDRTIVVTGATSGLGAATTIALATRHAHVVLAARDAERAAAVMDRIRARHRRASLEHLPLDLADLSSVRVAARTLLDRHASVDRIVANAGIMAVPLRRTVDGFELHLGVNHLGHFAFVGQVLPALLAATDGRVVTISSAMHRMAGLDLDDLDWERSRYNSWLAYGRSKLANLLFMAELQRRLEVAGSAAISVGAHPGYTDSNLAASGFAMRGGVTGRILAAGARAAGAVVAQPVGRGVLPQLYATTAPDVPGGSHWGPHALAEQYGYPAPARRSAAARDPALAAALWQRSEAMTGVRYELPVPSAS